MKCKLLFVLAAVFAAALTMSCEPVDDGDSGPSGVYSIHLGDGLAGKITVPESAKAGDAVTLQVTADSYVSTLGIKSMDGVAEFPVSLLNSGDVTFSFVMPEQDVKVNAAFSPTPDATATLTALWCDEGVVVQLGDGSSFVPGETEYIVEVEHDVDTVHLRWTTTHIAAQGVVSGKTTTLAEGANEAAVTVTAQDGETETAYNVKIVQKPNLLIQRIAISGPIMGGTLKFDQPDPAAAFIENIPLSTTGTVTVTFTTATTGATMSGADDFETIASKAVSFSGFATNTEKSGTVTVKKNVAEKEYTKTYEVTVFSDASFPEAAASMATGGEVKFIRTGIGQFDELHIFRFEAMPDITSTLANNQRGYDLVFTGGAPNIEAEVLVVAGGGSGGKGSGSGTVQAGAGGAGGVIYYGSEAPEGNYTKTGDSFMLDAASYAVKVGAGAAEKGLWSPGNNGISSIFAGTLTAVGGGAGGGGNNHSSTPEQAVGRNGGSGGGSFYSQAAGEGTPGQGNPGVVGGGTLGVVGLSWAAGGGGGGAGGTGTGITGGPGIELHIEGYAKTYAKGGSRNKAYKAGAPGTGTGGDGWSAGGSGIVLVRFPYTAPSEL